MAKFPGNLVVRRVTPIRNIFLASVCALAAILTLYIIYELGRYDGGYDRLAAAAQRSELRVMIEKLETTNRRLATQLAELDTLRIGRTQERNVLAREIGDLQGEVARQKQELAFYRDVVAQSVGAHDPESGLRIQQLRITPSDHPGHFRVHLVLLQGARPEATVSGSYVLSVDGQLKGKPSTLDFAALTDGRAQSQPFSFRYFGSLDQEIAIPPDFRPARLNLRLQSGHKPDDAPVTQSFPWSVEASWPIVGEQPPSPRR
ncbi:MAG TPA: DUF6776 family protein [Steroidobacteraceae bacterium]|nr:DUF6776 family protein [Steroidobacteraceae bacterium]